ncbi:MAG: phosphatidate cytidylyltransferase [Cytophagales bacterium]|nr:phosphatidate cytidylyltransferase [Cytophagales bacterium]
MSKFSDLLARGVTALIGAFVLIFCTVYNQWTFFGIFLLVTVLSVREYARLGDLPKIQIGWLYVSAIATYMLLFLFASGDLRPKYLSMLLPIYSVGLIIQLFLEDKRPLRVIGLCYLCLGYVVIPLSLLSFVVFFRYQYNPYLVVALLFIIWCMDTGAYFTGISIGKHKLFEKISPKKSWEGAIGGFLFAVCASWIFSLYLDQLSLWQWLFMGAVIAVTGILGDLVESFIKRVAATKDSGSSLPGHGGFLDRFDSLIFSIPFYLLLLNLL